MPAPLSPEELQFLRELMAPFHPSELSEKPGPGGRTLTWLDKRSLSNRLDSVCGPWGWDVKYEVTPRGYKCRLGIKNPVTGDWLFKEDGGGCELMTNGATEDVDGGEKSGYTNAFRRAAQDAWGIGRYLYNKGIPDFLDPSARAPEPGSAPPPHAQAPPPTQPQPPPSQQPAPSQGKPANFRIPTAGKGVYGWARDMETVFETPIVNGMFAKGEKLGYGRLANNWGQEQVNEICGDVIGYIKTLPNYQGQFDAADTRSAAPAANSAPAGNPDLVSLKKTLVEKVTLHIRTQLKVAEKPANEVLIASIRTIALQAKDGQGRTGQILQSLNDVADRVWLVNMVTLVDQQIAEANRIPVVGGEDGIPF